MNKIQNYFQEEKKKFGTSHQQARGQLVNKYGVKLKKYVHSPPLPPHDFGFSFTLSHFFLLSRYTFSQSSSISRRCTADGRMSGLGSWHRRMMFARPSGHAAGMVGRRFSFAAWRRICTYC